MIFNILSYICILLYTITFYKKLLLARPPLPQKKNLVCTFVCFYTVFRLKTTIHMCYVHKQR